MIKNRVFFMCIILIISSMTLDAGKINAKGRQGEQHAREYPGVDSALMSILDFYKRTVTTLQYDKEYQLNKKANKFSQSGVTYSKYANFSFNADYSKTKAKTLSNSFDITDVSFNDTLDLFGKNSYKIDTLALDLKSKKSLLNMQKEKLFISLVNMIALYNKTVSQLSLYKTVLNEQKDIYQKLEKLEQQGAITSIDLLRFKNQLTALTIKIMNQENEISKMKKHFNLYAPNQEIPILKTTKLLYLEKDYLSKNPQLNFNNVDAQKLLAQAKGLQHSYLPDVSAGLAYQQNDDPTSYGNNYSFKIGLQIPINSGNFKENQALRAEALSLKSKNIQYQIQRKSEYTARYQDYTNASKQLKILQVSLNDYEKSEKTIKTAYLRQYVDFNTYLQVITQTLQIKNQILELKSKKIREAIILNSISSGVVYE